MLRNPKNVASSNFRVRISHRFGLVPTLKNTVFLAAFFETESLFVLLWRSKLA